MILSDDCVMVFMTAPDVDMARQLVLAALRSRLVACANLVPGVESHYWWEGRLESAAEVLLVMKCSQEKLPELERCLLALHPYQVAELVVVPIMEGSEPYIRWIQSNCRASTLEATPAIAKIES